MPPNMRIRGLKKDCKFTNYLDSLLNNGTPELDYFIFADIFQGTKRAASNRYKDLLEKLSNNQSSKLTKIAKEAERQFNSRNDDCEFGKAYNAYWDKRSENGGLQQQMDKENQQTIIRLYQLTNERTKAIAEEVNVTRNLSNGSIREVMPKTLEHIA